jgi:hypothetical protein
VKQWKPTQWAFEKGQINSGVGPLDPLAQLKSRRRDKCLQSVAADTIDAKDCADRHYGAPF